MSEPELTPNDIAERILIIRGATNREFKINRIMKHKMNKAREIEILKEKRDDYAL